MSIDEFRAQILSGAIKDDDFKTLNSILTESGSIAIAEAIASLKIFSKNLRWYYVIIQNRDILISNLLALTYITSIPMKLCKAKSAKVREQVAQYTRDKEAILVLAKDKCVGVQDALRANVNVTGELLNHAYFNARSDRKLYFTQLTKITREIIDDTLDRQNENEMLWIIWNTRAPAITRADIVKIKEKIDFSSNPYFRQAVASRSDTPVDELIQFLNDKKQRVRITAINNEITPIEEIQKRRKIERTIFGDSAIDRRLKEVL
jgi:hypothetical protein